MAARRCSVCGINYPTLPKFTNCPIHDEPTFWINDVDPDEKWHEALERHMRHLETMAELAALVPRVHEVAPFEESGLLWITQEALFSAGVRFNSAFGGFRLFETDDGVYEIQGWDEPRRRWWVELVVENEPAPVPEESCKD